MIELGKVYTNVCVLNLTINRGDESFDLLFSFSSDAGVFSVNILGVRDLDGISEMFTVQRLWIDLQEGRQLEFGSFLLGLSSESYTEICFDKLI